MQLLRQKKDLDKIEVFFLLSLFVITHRGE